MMDEPKVTRGKVQPSLHFANVKTGRLQPDIWSELEAGMWRDYSVKNRLQNDAIGEVKQWEWKPEFSGIYTVNDGFEWDFAAGRLVEKLYTPHEVAADMRSFLATAERFFGQFAGHRIGVHLSGGLDSGLIICLLRHIGIPFVPVGLASRRFEFRTERRIQEVLAEYGSDARLLDFADYPFYSNLDKKPKHQVPDSCIKMIDASTALAEEFARSGCDVVLTGQGGDTLFVDAVPSVAGRSFNIGNEFTFPWEQDFIYGPRGIKLVSMFSDPDIIDQITNLRLGQREDALKLWARHFFRELLPVELSEFSYCADFFGLSGEGLEQAKPTVKELLEEAHEYMPAEPLFAPEGIKRIMRTDILTLEYKTYCDYCTKISIACWLHALFRKDD